MSILEHRPGGPGLDGSAGAGTTAGLGGTKTDRWIGMWSARVLCAFGIAYAVTMVAGFAAMGNLSNPLGDPYLAVMEVLILVTIVRGDSSANRAFPPERRRAAGRDQVLTGKASGKPARCPGRPGHRRHIAGPPASRK